MHRGRRNNRSRGFVLSQALVALGLTVMLIPLAVGSLSILFHQPLFLESVQDQIGILQLRRVFNASQEVWVSSEQVTLTYLGKEWTLQEVNHHLLLQPGTQIFLQEVDTCSFTTQNGLVLLTYERGNRTYERTLGKST